MNQHTPKELAELIEGLDLEQLHMFTRSLLHILTKEAAKNIWLPVEIAPQNEDVLVCNSICVRIARFERGVVQEFGTYDEDGEILGVTNWMPLPKLPTS